jgi:hypothetical protein
MSIKVSIAALELIWILEGTDVRSNSEVSITCGDPPRDNQH